MLQMTSRWRINDVVAYDSMRDAAVKAFALLGVAIQSDGPRADDARTELANLRDEVLSVDAYDRAAVTALTSRIEDLIRDFESHASRRRPS